jgi:hypothetical protein
MEEREMTTETTTYMEEREMTTTTYTVSNIAGGSLRRFRSDRDGRPSGASVRHAREQGHMGFTCSDPDMHDAITQVIADSEED